MRIVKTTHKTQTKSTLCGYFSFFMKGISVTVTCLKAFVEKGLPAGGGDAVA